MRTARRVCGSLVFRVVLGWAAPALLVVWLSGCATAQRPRCEIGPEAYQGHVDYLASDELGGRGLGSLGIEAAAQYIAGRFKDFGLQPAAGEGTYYQAFEVKLRARLTDDGELEVAGADVTPEQGVDYLPFPFSSETEFDGEVVFAGYGVVFEDRNHDDFADFDVTGKVVLLLRGEPPAWAEEEETDYTPHAEFSNKVYNVKEHGGAAVLIVNQRLAEGQADELTSWDRPGGGGPDADYGLPALHVTRLFAERLLSAGGLESLGTLQDKLDGGAFASAALPGISVRGRAGIERETAATRNVMGIIPGKGRLAEEIVVIGAHYDHLGRVVPRQTFTSPAKRIPEIHNGADDNASGTAGVIELARIFGSRDNLRRSVMFVAFSGEESGLLGSKYFVKHPPVDLGRVVAMLNLDMIGRLREGSTKVQVFGTQSATEFEPMLERLAKKNGFELQGSAGGFGASDHTSFYINDIPSLHFFTGLHKDYHLPSDDADQINAQGAVALLAYVHDVAVEIIEADSRPTYQKVASSMGTSRSHYRVRIGIMPSFADDGEGLGVDGVSAGGPAEAAGIQDGDLIIREGGTEVRNIYDHMAALRKYKPGDQVDVVVLREGKELTFTVTLAGK